MALLNDHRILITGVLTDDSLAFGIAKRALEEGATIALSGAGRGLSLTKRTARNSATSAKSSNSTSPTPTKLRPPRPN